MIDIEPHAQLPHPTPLRAATFSREREKGSRASITLLLAAAISLYSSARAAAPPRDDAIAVTVVRAARHCFTDRVLASGVFVARHLVEVRPERESLVVGERLAEAGDVVVKDQVLAKLVAPQAPQEAVAVKAPVAGTLLAENAIVGAYAATSAGDPLFRIAENDEVELKAEIVAGSLPRVAKGMVARLRVVGLGDIDGRVAATDDGVDAQTQLGTLRLSVGADPRLRVGGFAHATIDTGQDCALALPLSAMLFGVDGAVVATVHSDRVIMRRVSTGLVEGGTIEIRGGLGENDLVVARAAPFLRDGDHVRPVTSPP